MTDDSLALLEGIEKLANHPKVIKACEPNVLSHKQIGQSEIIRVLYAQKLLLEENERQ